MKPVAATDREQRGKLTGLQYLFVQEYLKDLNATQAVVRAGYKTKYPDKLAGWLIGNPRVQAALDEAQAERNDLMRIDAAYVLKQAVKLHERCMQEIEPFTDRKGNQLQQGGRPLYTFNAQAAVKALELVGKHVNIGAFAEQHVHKGAVAIRVLYEDGTTIEVGQPPKQLEAPEQESTGAPEPPSGDS